jgi:hypothetical protein
MEDQSQPKTGHPESLVGELGELVDSVKKSIFGNDELSKALDDEMQRPPDDRSPLT